MKHLSQLSPAECLLILNGSRVSMKELLKYTFLDLVLRRVLQVVEVEKPISLREGSRTYKYIKLGINFKTYYPRDHEQVFLMPFQKSDQNAILIRHFIKLGYNNIHSETHYKSILYSYPNLKRYFSRTIFQRLFGGSKSTAIRLETARQIQLEIKELEQKLPFLLLNNNIEAAEIMERIKGNVFLLKDTETSLHEHVERELSYELKNSN